MQTSSTLVTRFAIDGGLLLLSQWTNCLYAYNDTAREIWDHVEADRPSDRIAADLARAWCIPPERASADVAAITQHWREAGLIGPLRPTSPEAADPPPLPPAEVAGPTMRWTCTVRGIAIGFAVASDLADPVHLMFRHLETPDCSPQAFLSITRVDSAQFALAVNGAERLRSSDTALLVGALWQAVLEHIHPDLDWLALIHGGAVARNGRALGFSGPSGSGKSTLVAALTSRGFDYMADDMLTLSAPAGRLVPLPLPQSIKPGSIDLLAAAYPALAEAPGYVTKGLDARLLVQADAAWDIRPLPLAALVFPTYRRGAAPTRRRLSTFEALERLLAERIWLGHPLTERRIAAFLEWLAAMPCHAIAYGDLGDSLRLVDEIAG